MELEKICNIHNIGLYIDVHDSKKQKKLREKIEKELDGFQEYFCTFSEDKVMIIHDIQELNITDGATVVPGNAYYTKNKIFVSLEAKIAFQFIDNGMNFWVGKRVWYIPYMLKYLLEAQGSTFIHGAGIALNGKEGILLVAFGGIGKTCFVANTAKKDNVTLLGDDLIILKEDGHLLSYPRRFCLYSYHKSLFPNFFKRERVHIITVHGNSYIARSISKLIDIFNLSKFKIFCNYVPVSPLHLFPKDKMEVNTIPLKRVYVLRRVKGIKHIEIEETVNLEKVINFTQDVILHEWSVGIRLEYNYLAQIEDNYCEFVGKQRKIIEKCLNCAEKIYYVNIPDKMNAEEVSGELGKLLL